MGDEQNLHINIRLISDSSDYLSPVIYLGDLGLHS